MGRKFYGMLILIIVLMAGIGTAHALIVNGIQVDEESAKCVTCHQEKHIAPKVIEQWADSAHAKNDVGCVSCHYAEEGDFDAVKCPDSDILVASHPTPKDCSACHEQQVEEMTKSKHSYPFFVYANADRAVFEPIIATKQGCEQCHNVGILWPDGSVGECDVCHPKHTFSREVARNPFTCGECHMGPDHSHIEHFIESKHGNIFLQKGKNWDLNYKSSQAGIPIEAPVCTTCHMDAAPGVRGTHNLSERLAWESQAPWSYRTVWFEEELGSWEKKRERMEAVCKNCHSPNFVGDFFLAADLVNLQYNEIRRQMVKWAKKAEKAGVAIPLKAKTLDGKVKPFSKTVINAGWLSEPADRLYHSWHHEGRLFRQGALMMAADYTQWHGIWHLQHDLMESIRVMAEHGDKEAKKIYNSKSPSKFFTYKIYDLPGSIWGIWTKEVFGTPALYKIIPNYWEMVKANVENAYKKGFLSKAQWERWLERYNNRDYYLGTKFGGHPIFEAYKKRKSKELNLKDPNSALYKAINIGAPSPTPFEADPNNK